MFVNQPVGKEWLSRVTGYSDKPVSAALTYLLEMGFVITAGRYESWSINSQAIQLPEATQINLPASTRNYSDSIPTTTAINNLNIKEIKAAEVIRNNRNFSDSHKLLKFAHVGEPSATILADSDHVTPYYVAAHYLKSRAEKKSTGLFIHRMQSKDPGPDLNKKYHLVDCTCWDCGYLRFKDDFGLLEEEDFKIEEFIEIHSKKLPD